MNMTNTDIPDWTPKKGKGIIYMYTLDNGKKYVGQTIARLSKRHADHLRVKGKKGKGEPFVDRFLRNHLYKLIILCETDVEKLNEMENFYIFKYDTAFPMGYNILLNDESSIKRPISHPHEYCYVCFDRTGKKVGSFDTQKECGDFIKVCDSCVSRAIQKGTLLNDSYFIRKYAIDSEIPDTIQVQEIKKKKANSLKIDMYDMNHNYIKTYNAIREAERETGVSSSSIAACCKGGKGGKNGYYYAGGHIWEYHDPELKNRYNVVRDFTPISTKQSNAKKPITRTRMYYLITPERDEYFGNLDEIMPYCPVGMLSTDIQRKKHWGKEHKKGKFKGFIWGCVDD